jgi:hypothetical protein
MSIASVFRRGLWYLKSDSFAFDPSTGNKSISIGLIILRIGVSVGSCGEDIASGCGTGRVGIAMIRKIGTYRWAIWPLATLG